MPRNKQINARDFVLDFKQRTLIMGVMNLTPDSFSGDGRHKQKLSEQLRYAKRLIRQGADIIDLGAESSRPGAKPVSQAQELARLLPVVKILVKETKVPVSVDTYKINVAKAALEAGASIINNINGLKLSKEFVRLVAKYDAAIVLMHMRGNPQTMQSKTAYADLIKDICRELSESVEFCLENGIKEDKIIIDPGIGFAKTVEGNLAILQQLGRIQQLGFPVLVGPSRKSFIGAVLERPVEKRLLGTAAAVAVAIAHGANMVRVHDVGPIKDIVRLTDAIMHQKNYV